MLYRDFRNARIRDVAGTVGAVAAASFTVFMAIAAAATAYGIMNFFHEV